MALRSRDTTPPSPTTRTHRMVRLTVTDDGALFAAWVVMLPGGRRAERSVGVTPALAQQIVSRPAFQTMLDQIESDTFGRTGA